MIDEVPGPSALTQEQCDLLWEVVNDVGEKNGWVRGISTTSMYWWLHDILNSNVQKNS